MDVHKKILINGPSNCIRLINEEMNKILYIFININFDIQLECKDPNSKDFVYYLDKNFGKTENMIDFFFQTTPINELNIINSEKYKSKNNEIVTKLWEGEYSNEVYDYFIKIFKGENKKIRAHYFDITYFVEHIMTDLRSFDENSYNYLNKDFPPSSNEYERIENLLKLLLEDILYFRMIIFGKDNEKEKIKFNENEIKLIKYFTKIKKFTSSNKNTKLFVDVYDNIHENINEILAIIDNLFNLFDKLSKQYNQVTKMMINENNSYSYINKKTLDIMNRIYDNIDSLIEKCKIIINELSYLYFIRRYIEKEYITHGVLYSSDEASLKILYMLINKFGFKITNISHINTSINDFENKMKKIQYKNYKFSELAQYILPKEFNQCINMEGFPKTFK